MPVIVRCSECGFDHESRLRARTHSDFSRLNPYLGHVMEPCPACGSRPFTSANDREWRSLAGPGYAARR
jgi:ribosomal protein L37E